MGREERSLVANLVNGIGLTFDDVLILPQKSDLSPDSVEIASEVFKGLTARIPILSASMETVWSLRLYQRMTEMGAVCPIPTVKGVKFLEKTLKDINRIQWNKKEYPFCLLKNDRPIKVVNLSPFDFALTEFCEQNRENIDYVILDCVQPYSDHVYSVAKKMCDRGFRGRLIIGNIVTAEAAQFFLQLPLAGLKVGLGSGAICTTRLVNGIGCPQWTALQKVIQVSRSAGVPVVSDGGIKNLGDIAKALGAGAHGVMMGRLFASCDESGAKSILRKGKRYKIYVASVYSSLEEVTASQKVIQEAIKKLKKKNHRFEGVSGLVPNIGSCQLLLYSIEKGVKNALAFSGTATLEEFHQRAQFIQVSKATHDESKPHSLVEIISHNQLF